VIAAVVAVVFGTHTVRVLAAGAVAWVLIVAVMAQAGYAGNPRYLVAAAALGCVLAGVGAALMWPGAAVIVAATGPSLTPDVVEACRVAHAAGTHRAIAVSDAWRVMPWADAMYSLDAKWWDHHKGAPEFRGVRWSAHDETHSQKRETAERYGIRLVRGAAEPGFSTDRRLIHYGGNSGFQAINLAIRFGAAVIVLVGFNLQHVDGRSHFFGDHPEGVRRSQQSPYERFLADFVAAEKRLRLEARRPVIINATPATALTCWPVASLEDALAVQPWSLENVA